ncbi:MAG: hypothetical protein AABY08_05000 [Candidatus Thermoplasmatota archaeon]|jgi:hypothetical protein
MTEVIFLTSIQDHQTERVKSLAVRLKKRLPAVDVKVLEGSQHRDLMAKHKIRFGPAVIIDDRIEYVGVPRFTMLLDRLLQIKEGRPNPRTAGEKPAAAPAKPPLTAPAPGSSPPGSPPTTST